MQTKIDIKCGNCELQGNADSQFCAGCGQPLWQKCPDCGNMALLVQPFCNGCGSNLEAALQKRIEGLTKLLDRARNSAKEGLYRDALRLLESIAKPPHYRFNDVASQAQQLANELTAERDHWQAEVDKATKRVARYQESDRYDDIIRVLARIPAGILPEELKGTLDHAKSKVSTTQGARGELQQALEKKEYETALHCLIQLSELEPENKSYQPKIAEVSKKLISKARRYQEKGNYKRAVELFEAVPENLLDAASAEMQLECEEILFSRNLLAKATLMSPLVIGIVERLGKLTPDDPLIDKLRKKGEKLRRSQSQLISQVWPEWMKPERGLLGIAMVPTRVPNAFPGARPEVIATKGAQFWVAIGLAIQAATYAMPKGDFLRSEKSKGLLGLLGGKRSKGSELGVGIDVGESSLKGVKLRMVGEQLTPQIEQVSMVPLERKQGKKLDKETLEGPLQKLLAELQPGDARTVVSYPGNELVPRFLLLPPNVDRKKLDDFVLQDARANIPINMELLHTAYHVSDNQANELIGPSAILMAGRKVDIAARKELLESAGCRVDGLQPESLAVCNALREFLKLDEGLYIDAEDATQVTTPGQSLADLVIDVGHDRTNIIIMHPNGIWQRTISWGLHDMTRSVATAMQLTHSEADRLRREPLKAKHYQQVVEALERGSHVPRREIERSAYVARDAIGDLRLRRVILIGGGAYQPFLSSWMNGCPY